MAWRALLAGTAYSWIGASEGPPDFGFHPRPGIADDHVDHAVDLSQRQGHVLAGDVLAEPAGQLRVRRLAAQVADLDSELLGQGGGDLALVEHARADQQLAEAQPRFRLFGQGLIQLLLGDQLLLEQQGAEQRAPTDRCLRGWSRLRRRLRRCRFRWCPASVGRRPNRDRRPPRPSVSVDPSVPTVVPADDPLPPGS